MTPEKLMETIFLSSSAVPRVGNHDWHVWQTVAAVAIAGRRGLCVLAALSFYTDDDEGRPQAEKETIERPKIDAVEIAQRPAMKTVTNADLKARILNLLSQREGIK